MTAFIKVMSFVGDFDDAFYDDERARDVWNEAAAAGFQLGSWIALLTAAVLPWLPGTVGSWISGGILIALAVVTLAVVSYARSLQVDAAVGFRLRPRLVAVLVLYGAAVAGIALEVGAVAESGFAAGFAKGVPVGLLIFGVIAIVQGTRNFRLARRIGE